MNCMRLHDIVQLFLLSCPAPVCTPKCAACIMYLWKCVRVFTCMQELFWPVNLHLSLSPSSLQACRRWSVKASAASLPHWGCQSSPLVSCRHSGSRQMPKREDRGRHRTYNNNSGNKFERREDALAHRNHSITYFNNVKEGVVCFCLHQRER